MERETVKGYIDHITFQNQENGYTVMSLVTDAGELTCVGTAKGYTAGETVELEGVYTEHPVYGRQLKFSAIRAAAPTDRVSLMRYLCSGAIKGIGEKRAVKIIDHFGEDTYRVLEEEPERLIEIKGISPRIVREIAEQLAEKRDQRRAILYMQQYGISAALCDKLYTMYGDEIYGILKHNPYRLADEVPAVGFRKADEIARRAGIERDSEYRIRAGLQYELARMSAEGHCYYPRDLLCRQTAELLGTEGTPPESVLAAIDAALPELALERRIVQKQWDGEERVYLSSYYSAERYCAKRLQELHAAYRGGERGDVESVRAAAAERGMMLDASQERAVCECLHSGVFILSGGPGTGKTTTINVILQCLAEQGRSFALAAPTGRAAKRMSEATGYTATTLHRLLELGAESGEDGAPENSYAETEPLEMDCVVVDEASMVDLHLLRALLGAIPSGAQLLLVGDVDQLPSVGPGQILRDIMESGCFPTVRLDTVHRQGEESHIVDYAHRINRGEQIDFGVKHKDFFLLEKDSVNVIYRYIYDLVSDIIPKHLHFAPKTVQILTPMRKGPLGVEGLNQMLQNSLNPSAPDKNEVEIGTTVFREGDKVMQIKNNYQLEWEILGAHQIAVEEGKGVFNGDTGEIREINTYLKVVTVVYDDGRQVLYNYPDMDELELAYAVTIHKSQGSEYPVVILPILSGPPRLLTRNLLYTAVTRAKVCVILIGSAGTLHQMIARDYVQRRYTSLRDWIPEMGGGADGGI